MNTYLDQLFGSLEKYRAELKVVMDREAGGKNQSLQLGVMGQPDRARVATAALSRAPTSSRSRVDIVYPDVKEGSPEEMVFRIQGFIVSAQLPPFMQTPRSSGKTLQPKQSVKITGLGLEEFDQALKGIQALRDVVSSQYDYTTLTPWKVETERTFSTLEASNRYFSSSHEASGQETVTLGKQVDPMGILLKIGQELRSVHVQDNVVAYYERAVNKDTSIVSYQQISPGFIRPGHLVELQVGVCSVPIGKGKNMMLVKLRSVCVLSRLVEHDFNTMNLQRMINVAPMNKVKRKVGYDEDVEEMETSIEKRMRISDDQDENMTN
ncbi:hypothetical protein BXZ70DRAFT_1013197 [Cristinia sonorae]|uniref:Uncharacterized protein n=1 Tax=Cristinia sonorae TaxID=1940300 RepID=A0A8K0UDG7_9AGAR|nr:hypothetical protein BXZ70DRAFT_1013197 [Cristinia sonorae]